MRVYYTRPLLSIVEGTQQVFQVSGRLGDGATIEMKDLEELPSRVKRDFNEDYSGGGQTIGDVLGPTLRTPDAFEFSLEVGRLRRLARECLIEVVRLSAENWAIRQVPIRELHLGGENEVLRRDERARLKTAIREVWKRPVRGKVFVLGDDITGLPRRALAMGLSELGADLLEQVGPSSDYLVTDREDLKELALTAGAKEVIDTLTTKVMQWDRK